MRPTTWIAGIVALAVAGAAGFYVWQRAVPVVETAQPARGPAVHAVYATGVVEPVVWAKVAPLVRGRIVETCKCEGRAVAKGDFLARLDDAELKALLAELSARAEFLRLEVERQRQLVQSRVVSPQAFERATSEYGQSQAAVGAARERLSQLTLRAPIDGIVLRSDGEVGEVVATENVLFWVGKPKPLWVVGEVDEEDIPFVSVGQKVLIKADAFAGRTLAGEVAQITPKGDPINKNFRVRIALPDDTPLLIGMTVEANIVVASRDDALLVPAGAVSAGRVWVVEDGRARSRAVTTGIAGRDRVEIRDGLAGTETIIAEPPAGLADGARVRIRPRS
jgi:RND family efflux transporter MFP subunit